MDLEEKSEWRYIRDSGRALQIISELSDMEIFDNLSKHNPYFDSVHEVESDKLYDLRCKLSYIHEKLLEAWSFLSTNA